MGDAQTIRVNSGEAVLTERDQNRFLRLLEGQPASSQSPVSGQVVFRIKGSDLLGTLQNFENKKKKI